MVKCNTCGSLLDELPNIPLEERLPCPSCGSKSRLYEKELNAEVKVRSSLKLKARHGQPGEVKPFLELQTGDSLFKETGEWNKREKIEDRENDRYVEHIVDPRTGEILHHCEESLRDHQGHGSAKRKK